MPPNRCAIFDRIDRLGEARTVSDLARALRPILDELAYGCVMGDASVLDAREQWHSQYSDRLYEASRAERPPPADGRAHGHAHGIRGGAADLPPNLRAIMNGTYHDM